MSELEYKRIRQELLREIGNRSSKLAKGDQKEHIRILSITLPRKTIKKLKKGNDLSERSLLTELGKHVLSVANDDKLQSIIILIRVLSTMDWLILK